MHSPRIKDGKNIRRLTEEELSAYAIAKQRGAFEEGADAAARISTSLGNGGLADAAGSQKSPRGHHMRSF